MSISAFLSSLPITSAGLEVITSRALQTPVPDLPNFVQNDNRWERFADYFSAKENEFWQRNYRPVQIFPSACDSFSFDLEVLLAMSYIEKYRGGKIVLTIEGKEAILNRQFCDLRAQGGTIHYYLELLLGGEEWIVDPAWKQFAGKQVKNRTTSDDTEFCANDSYNIRLEKEFPNILVIKRNDLTSLIRMLGKEAKSEEIELNIRYWDKKSMQQENVLGECIEESSVYTSKRPYFEPRKWQLFQVITGNKCSRFEEFSRGAVTS